MLSHIDSDPKAHRYQRSAFPPAQCLRMLRTPLRFLKGVGPKRAEHLERLGLRTVEDLLYHLPFRYDDRRRISRIQQAVAGLEQTFVGRLFSLQRKYVPARRRYLLTGFLSDGSGSLALVWYRTPPYLLNRLRNGIDLLVHGKVEPGPGALKRIAHPEFESVDPGEEKEMERILPVYPKTEGLPLRTIRTWIAQALEGYGIYLPSFLPIEIAQRQTLSDLCSAMALAHFPPKSADLGAFVRLSSPAHRSIVFDEFFYLQLGLGLKKKNRAAEAGISFVEGRDHLVDKMRTLLPFKLTGAQERVLREVHGDMQAPQPMQRLIQGDVGCGKTIVAWLASLKAIENGFQAVWLAPTELLAEQHFANLKPFADRLGLSAALLTGSLASGLKKKVSEGIAKGQIQFVVGTHALIQEGVQAPRMGLGVIDEQHRFGVIQRMALKSLADWASASDPARPQPDILLMSATPIPRSLAMVLYGDLEVSSLEEMPPGRSPILTKLFGETRRKAAYEAVREEIMKGRQAYIVYPLVEASDRLPLRDATRMAEELSNGAFGSFRVGLIHGKMKQDERDRVMRRFKEGDLQLLVATTVIEVGIDVPNATAMVIEHAERFGLSQLHQLRGRVGRGKEASRCFLLYQGAGDSDGLKRLRIMEKEQNGFKIAQADLALRGPGELLGTRQSGLADFRLGNLIRDSQLLLEARKEALAWLALDPTLSSKDSQPLREVLLARWGERLELGTIG
jgi:ATP-dependent DNA helicase RecG